MTKNALFMSGFLGELQVYDLTEYPETVNTDEQIHIKKRVLFERKQFN